MTSAKRILGSSIVALLAAGGGWFLAAHTTPDLAFGLLPVLGAITSVTTTLYFQVLRRVEETRDKVILDEPHRTWFREQLDDRKRTLSRRWAIAFCFGLLSAGIGVSLKFYPFILLLMAGYALLALALLSVMLMAVEFKMISDLSAELHDDAEARKRKRDFAAKINAHTA